MKIFFLCFMMFCASLSVRAETLYYQAHGAGMHLMDAVADYESTSKDYHIDLTTTTKGLLSFFVDSQSFFKSRGIWKKAFPLVQSSIFETEKGDKLKTRTLDFSNKKDHLDYASLFLHRLFVDSPQTTSYLVFDGKRILNITFQYEGEVLGSQIHLPAYRKLLYYTVSVTILSGKKKGWFFNRMKDKENSPLHLYFTPKEEGNVQRRKLVYAAFDTAIFGQIEIRESLPEH